MPKQEQTNEKTAICNRCSNEFPMMQVEFCVNCMATLCPECDKKYGVCSDKCERVLAQMPDRSVLDG